MSGSIPVLKPDIITNIFDSINNTNNRLLSQGIQGGVILRHLRLELPLEI